jgi:serine phosphatase RsbU (regulator of sigma subunit)
MGALEETKGLLYFDNVIYEGNLLTPYEENLQYESPAVRALKLQTEWIVNDCGNESCDILLPQGVDNEFEIITQTSGSAVCMPLFSKNLPVGVLMLMSKEKNVFDANRINLLRALTSYISIALENANSYQELTEANEIIEQNNRRIMDSLRYANTIQQAFLPQQDLLSAVFKEHFVIFKPKDVVSGDFYWLQKVRDLVFVAVGDCTGHGVPGAFMSLIAERLLEQIIIFDRIYEPEEVLRELDLRIHQLLRQEQTGNDDGLDIILCRIEQKENDYENKIIFSGAKRPLILVSQEKYHTFRGSRKTIGGRARSGSKVFERNEIVVREGDVVFLTTDGYSDQNDPNNKKIGSLEPYLLRVAGLPLVVQKDILELELKKHKQHEKQRDDITILAFKCL